MAEPPLWVLRRTSLPLDRPLVMGVINVTPDSFSDGGRLESARQAVEYGVGLVESGADIIDVGGESARPGAEPVDIDEELWRVMDVVGPLADRGYVVSIDTAKPAVARAALEVGAEIVNDVTGGRDPEMLEEMASGAGVVLMHMLGSPRTMQDNPRYDDVVAEVLAYLLAAADRAQSAGVSKQSIVIDPGIGFGKTLEHNLELLREISRFVSSGYPVLVGASRKQFLGTITGIDDPAGRDVATAVVTGLVVSGGAAVVRVHDAATSVQAARLARAISTISGSPI